MELLVAVRPRVESLKLATQAALLDLECFGATDL